jgi:flagellar biosynthesis protein FlhG
MEKTSKWLQSFNSECTVTDQLNHPLVNHKAKKISITGGKGGVGKTSFSLKFAKELSYAGKRVLLIDCDYNLSNTAIRLGLPLSNRNFYSLLTAQKSFEDCLHKEDNFHLLSACNGDLDLFESELKLEDLIIDIINEHDSEYDFILLDCPAGLSKESLTLNAYCDERIFVVTPDKASITDSYSLMKILSNKYNIRENHLIVNMYSHQKQFRRVVSTISETAENFLGCRTHVLGGIAKIDVEYSRFDTFFLSNRDSQFQKRFLKVVGKYTDDMRTSSNVLELGKRNLSTNFEQNAQSI